MQFVISVPNEAGDIWNWASMISIFYEGLCLLGKQTNEGRTSDSSRVVELF